jgi:hypothetical protein
MPGLVPGIHVLTEAAAAKPWMAGSNPAMTINAFRRPYNAPAPKVLQACTVPC